MKLPFLPYIQTGLYVLVAGSTLWQVVASVFWKIAGIPLILIGVAIMGTAWLGSVK